MNKSYVPKGVEVAPLRETDIIGRVNQIKVATSVCYTKEGRLDVVRLLELLGVLDFVDYEIVEDSELPGVAGELERKFDGSIPLIKLRESIFNQAANGQGFSRFTIAHEIGHYFLHSKQSIPLHRFMPTRSYGASHPPFRDSEWQANTFAAHLLICEKAVREEGLSPEEVSIRFGVSDQAANVFVDKVNK